MSKLFDYLVRSEEELEALWDSNPKAFKRLASIQIVLALGLASVLGFATVRTVANQIAIYGCDAHPMASNALNERLEVECGSGLD